MANPLYQFTSTDKQTTPFVVSPKRSRVRPSVKNLFDDPSDYPTVPPTPVKQDDSDSIYHNLSLSPDEKKVLIQKKKYSF